MQVLDIQLNVELLLGADVGTSPLEVDVIADVVGVAKLELESEGATVEESVVDPSSLFPPLLSPDSVGLGAEEVETSLVIEDGVVEL